MYVQSESVESCSSPSVVIRLIKLTKQWKLGFITTIIKKFNKYSKRDKKQYE